MMQDYPQWQRNLAVAFAAWVFTVVAVMLVVIGDQIVNPGGVPMGQAVVGGMLIASGVSAILIAIGWAVASFG